MDVTDQSNLLSSIRLMKELKDLITCQARAIFSAQHTGHTYDVIVSKIRAATGYEYEARLILYTGQHDWWDMLLVNPSLCESPVDAMADLLEGLYERAGRAGVRLEVGETYYG